MQSPSPLNPLGAKGAGEGGATGSLPALANAVADALGGRHVDPPFTSRSSGARCARRACDGGPLRFEADGVPYAGALRVVDVDEDAGVVGAHAQARATRGWAGVAADITDAHQWARRRRAPQRRRRRSAAGDGAASPRSASGSAPRSRPPTTRRGGASSPLRAALAVGVGVARGPGRRGVGPAAARVKPAPFDYVAPRSLDAALAALGEDARRSPAASRSCRC